MVEVIDPAARDRRLEELLRHYHSSRANRVLVFALYKKEAARLETALQRRGWKVGRPGSREETASSVLFAPPGGGMARNGTADLWWQRGCASMHC